MKLLLHVRRCLIVGATLGLLMPPAGFAGERHQISPIRDVALQGGTLHGEVLSEQGQAAVGQSIAFTADGALVARTVVGADGKFAVGGLRPGVYSVAIGESQSVIRLWSEAAAPPAATQELLLLGNDSQVVRGIHAGGFPKWNHPILVGGLLVGAGVIGGVIGYNIREFDPAS